MMKRVLAITVILTLCFFARIAQGKGFGIGIIVGEPTGISLKNRLGNKGAIDGAIAWSFGGKQDALHIHADYLLNSFNLLEKGNLSLYLGVGGRIKLKGDDGKDNGDTKLGVRIPVGLNYILTSAPLDVFLEIVPLLDLTPSTSFAFNGAIGIRYYF